jgi:hypothetical protein
MRVTNRPKLQRLLLAGLLACALCGSAQAGLSDWFHSHSGHNKNAPKALHSSTKQPPTHLLRSQRQGKIKPLSTNLRTAARTLQIKRQKPH